MKINKKKLLESTLVEDAETVTATDSTADIADAIQDTIETIPDEAATDIADKTKKVADQIEANQIVINDDDWKDAIITNELTEALDHCYKNSLNIMARGKSGILNSNLLVEGLPGSGKTSIIKDWCRAKGLTLVELNASDTKTDAAINGMPIPPTDATASKVKELVRLYDLEAIAPLLNDLHPELEGKCVLFVDELNRQLKTEFRRPFMSIFAGKTNVNGVLDFRKNLLFSVAAINPFGPQYHDRGVAELIPAELDRFEVILDYDSTPAAAKSYFIGMLARTLHELGIIAPGSELSAKYNGYIGPTRKLTDAELQKAVDQIRQTKIALAILDDPNFKFDDREDFASLGGQKQKRPFSARTLSNMIENNAGDISDIKLAIKYARLLDSTTEMLNDILNFYVQPSDADIKAEYNLDKDPAELLAAINDKSDTTETDTAKTATGTAETETDVEDDEDLFLNSANSSDTIGGKKVLTGADFANAASADVDTWLA